jgi:predicted nucleic acid-binding protein
MTIGELALGSLRDRKTILALLSDLPETPVATHSEVFLFVELHALHGAGLSLVDAHLLAALRLSSCDRLWTRDRCLRVAADKLGVSAELSS